MTTVSEPFTDMLQALVALRKYVKIFYFTDLHELLSTTSVIKSLEMKADGEYLVLASGESIRTDRLLNVDGVYVPGQEDYADCLVCRISK